MKNRIIILSLCASCLLAIVAFVYNSETKTDPLALSPIVAKRVTTPTGTLVSCNLKALKDTVDIPLSYLTEELQVVKLDNRDEARVGGWIRTTVGEKYILVSNNKQTPYKLFTDKGPTNMETHTPTSWTKPTTVSTYCPGRVTSCSYSIYKAILSLPFLYVCACPKANSE